MACSSKLACLALALAAAAVVAPCAQLGKSTWQQQDVLDAHNAARAAVGVGKARWDDKVAAYAQSYARRRRGDCKLRHSDKSDRPDYGENISRSTNKNFSVSAAVGRWVAEKQYYHHDTNSCSAPAGKSCGHYTQVVWRNSTAVGCAGVVCDNHQGVFVTCNYKPPGNYRGQSPY